jgi:hypothetical protein
MYFKLSIEHRIGRQPERAISSGIGHLRVESTCRSVIVDIILDTPMLMIAVVVVTGREINSIKTVTHCVLEPVDTNGEFHR